MTNSWEQKLKDVMLGNGSKDEILSGKTLNINCNMNGPTSKLLGTPQDAIVKTATIKISGFYKIDMFGLIQSRRNITPTLFTWYTGASSPQWLKGEFAKP
jgi:hypothetical protein